MSEAIVITNENLLRKPHESSNRDSDFKNKSSSFYPFQ